MSIELNDEFNFEPMTRVDALKHLTEDELDAVFWCHKVYEKEHGLPICRNIEEFIGCGVDEKKSVFVNEIVQVSVRVRLKKAPKEWGTDISPQKLVALRDAIFSYEIAR